MNEAKNNFDFSKIIDWNEKLPKNNKIKLEKLKKNIETRTQHSKLAENIWFNLEKVNYLARINDVAEMCNENKDEFLNICNNNLWLNFA